MPEHPLLVKLNDLLAVAAAGPSRMELLSLRKGSTLTKEMFVNHLYGGMDEPEIKIIDVFICKLRKKLSMATNGINYVETVWGRGYILRECAEDTLAIAA